MQRLVLSKDKTHLIIDHEDNWGGCRHNISIKTVFRALNPLLRLERMKANKIREALETLVENHRDYGDIGTLPVEQWDSAEKALK